MKFDLKEIFKSKRNKIHAGIGALALVLIVSGGIYATNRASNMKEQARIEEEKQKDELAKKEKEEKEKLELAKAEEQKARYCNTLLFLFSKKELNLVST